MEEQKKLDVSQSTAAHQPIRLIEDEVPPLKSVQPVENTKSYLGKAGRSAGFMGMAALMIAGMLKGRPTGGLRTAPKPENKKLSTAARKLKARKRTRLEMQKESRRINRGAKGCTARHTHR